MILAAILGSNLSNLIHERNQDLNREHLIEIKIILGVYVLNQEPILLVEGLVSNEALVDP